MSVDTAMPENALERASACMKGREDAFKARYDAKRSAIAGYERANQRARHAAALAEQYGTELQRAQAANQAVDALTGLVETALGQPAAAQEGEEGHAMAPVAGNALVAPRRFRVLVWNLENFTRDSRPRGAEAVSSRRNQARIAAIAATMLELDVDLLLVMETGSDVGQAMTQLANRVGAEWQPPQNDPGRPKPVWHPLVSTATQARPALKERYLVALKRPTPLRALALGALADDYSIDAGKSAPPISDDQILDALGLLPQVSTFVSAALGDIDLGGYYLAAINKGGDMTNALVYVLKTVAEAFDLIVEASTVGGREGLVEILRRDSFLGNLSDAIAFVRESLHEFHHQRLAIPLTFGAFEAIELVLLFLMKLSNEDAERYDYELDDTAFTSDQVSPGARLPLMVFFCTAIQNVELARKKTLIEDEDIVFGSLLRIGAETFHSETYGMVYRPPEGERSMEEFFSGKIWSWDGSQEKERVYGVIRRDAHGELTRIQTDLLNWRSALQVAFPMGGGAQLPLALYHTRYSGSAAISGIDPRLGAAENTILARCMSVADVARTAVLAWHHQKVGLPLIVGDFNIPTDYLDEPQGDAAERREIVRQEFSDEMASYGYVRHSAQGKHPRTTLAAYSSLATGAKVYSESYDGVYAPVTGIGVPRIRSAAVGLEMVVTPALGAWKIVAPPAEPLSNADVEIDDEGDDPQPDAPGGKEAMEVDEEVVAPATFGDVALEQLGRVYNSFLGQIPKEVEKRKAWLQARVRKGEATELLQQYEARFAELRAKRLEWFRDRCAGNDSVAYRQTFGKDFVEDLALGFAAVAESAGLYDAPTYRKLEVAMARVYEALKGMETEPDRRRAIVYRAIVSDHIPTLIQMDL